MIEEFFDQVGEWTWIIIGLILLVLEVFLTIPGSLFLFTGIAALVIGASALLFDWAWQFQLVGFGVLSLALVLLGRRYFAERGESEGDATLNERGARLLGKIYPLVEPIVDGGGRVKIGDSTWAVSGSDAPEGTRVRVIGADGSTLIVEPE